MISTMMTAGIVIWTNGVESQNSSYWAGREQQRQQDEARQRVRNTPTWYYSTDASPTDCSFCQKGFKTYSVSEKLRFTPSLNRNNVDPRITHLHFIAPRIAEPIIQAKENSGKRCN